MKPFFKLVTLYFSLLLAKSASGNKNVTKFTLCTFQRSLVTDDLCFWFIFCEIWWIFYKVWLQLALRLVRFKGFDHICTWKSKTWLVIMMSHISFITGIKQNLSTKCFKFQCYLLRPVKVCTTKDSEKSYPTVLFLHHQGDIFCGLEWIFYLKMWI